MSGARRRRQTREPHPSSPTSDETQFQIPERAQRLLEAQPAPDSQEVAGDGSVAGKAIPVAHWRRVGGYSGFVCPCGARVDYKLRGPHAPDCPNRLHNQGLQPWTEDE